MATQEQIQSVKFPSFVSERQQQLLNTLFGRAQDDPATPDIDESIGIIGRDTIQPAQQVAGFTAPQQQAFQQTQEAIASFIADSFEKFGILGGIIGAGASGVVGSLMSQGIKSVAAAEGMDEVVTEPTLILAGEEGAEYVNIEPTQNEGAGMGGGGQIIFQGNVLSKDFIEDEAIPMIRDAVRRGHTLA